MNTMNLINDLGFGDFDFNQTDDLFDPNNFERNLRDFPLCVLVGSEMPETPIEPQKVNFMSVSQRQLFDEPLDNFEANHYEQDSKFDSLEAVKDFCMIPNQFGSAVPKNCTKVNPNSVTEGKSCESNDRMMKDLSVPKADEKDEHHTVSDHQDTMKNSSDSASDFSMPMKTCNHEELIQKLTSSVVDKDSNAEALDLATRRDVVNKTILRIVRRFYIQSFKDMFAKKFKSKEAKSKWYYEYVKKFTAEIFGSAHPDLDVLQTYMCSIINPKHMTSQDVKATGLEKEQFFTFHNCLYKYSHTRLINLFEVKPLGALYDYFYKCPGMTEIIRSEPSVNKNLTIYQAAFRDFSRIFHGMADPTTLTF